VAERFGIAPEALLTVLRDTVFHPGYDKEKRPLTPFSDAELAAALVLVEKYELDPFCKEIYVTRTRGKLLVIVPIDGWIKIANREKRYHGCKFADKWDANGKLVSITCWIKVAGREWPIEVTEYLDECYRVTDPWDSHPHRMLQWKVFIQCCRVAFGISGLLDDDEAGKIIDLEGASAARTQQARYLAEPAMDFTAEAPKREYLAQHDPLEATRPNGGLHKLPPRTEAEPSAIRERNENLRAETERAPRQVREAGNGKPVERSAEASAEQLAENRRLDAEMRQNMASERTPAPREAGEEPMGEFPPVDDPAGPTKEELFDVWNELRNKLDGKQIVAVRQKIGGQYVNAKATPQLLRQAIAAAESILAAR
jgi:hypothetical protein